MTTASKNHPLNCGSLTGAFARTHRKSAISERAFDLAAAEQRRIVTPGSQSNVEKDKDGLTAGTPLKVFLRETSAGYQTDFVMYANIVRDGYFQQVSFSSESPGVLASPGPGEDVATFRQAGPCILRGTSADGEVSLARVTAAAQISSTVDRFSSWVPGTLAAHCTSQIDLLVDGATETSVYSVANGTSFARNSECWANRIDISCASPWNSAHGPQRAGTLISPRHVLFCKHAGFYPPVGATMFFVSTGGAVESRLLQAIEPAGINADFVVGLLDGDVGPGISFAKCLPTNFSAYLPGVDAFSTIPVMYLNQTERASIAGLRIISSIYSITFSQDYEDYFATVVVGDSGNPAFLVVDQEPVLLGVFSTPTNGSHVAHYAADINTAMTTLGGGYQLTTVDLSGFPTY
jgi:hypothetical protein